MSLSVPFKKGDIVKHIRLGTLTIMEVLPSKVIVSNKYGDPISIKLESALSSLKIIVSLNSQNTGSIHIKNCGKYDQSSDPSIDSFTCESKLYNNTYQGSVTSIETGNITSSKISEKTSYPTYTNSGQTVVPIKKNWLDLQSEKTCTGLEKVVPAVLSRPAFDPEVIYKLTAVLSAHFANGYRLNSPIELARFISFAEQNFGEKIVLSPEELKRYVSACGTIYDGKVYPVSVETKEQIKNLVDEYFSEGAQAIFFAEFYAKNENWLFKGSVVSEVMLIQILRKLFPKQSFTRTYFGYKNVSVSAALEGEILRVWSDDVLLTYAQLAERLRYIPFGRIKSFLSQNADFIWSSEETFSHLRQIKITAEEQQVIREAAMRECKDRGYASITDLPFGEIEERNYELSVTAVHNAVYRICLSDEFDKKGKIIAPKGVVFDALTIMKRYCRTIDKCSLDDLLAYAKELTGEVHRWIPMEAGNTILVRIDKDTYVADKYLHFKVDIIDEAIGLFVKEDYLPLKSFTTFGTFPDCGQTWNLFLLESYCRRFSRMFRFDTTSVNSRNAGAVIRNSCGMDYTEIMADAVATADVPLMVTAVGKFLLESGYTGRSTTAKVNVIITNAMAMRKRMN